MPFQLTFCSDNTTEQKYCSEFHKCGIYPACPKVPNFSRNPTECFEERKHGMFSCLNRMDQYPGIFSQSLHREDYITIANRVDPFKLNKDFTFNSSGILCNGDKLIPWTKDGFDDLYDTPSCQSKTGRKISGGGLWEHLHRDMGFKGREYISEDYLKNG